MSRTEEQRLVSVIVPSYNSEKTIRRCLKSIIQQTYGDWEVILVDNSSTDSTIEIAKSFRDQRIHIIRTRNYGIIAASRNLGIQHSKGNFLAFLDSDDYWKKNKLEESVKYLNTGSDLVYHRLKIYRGPSKMTSYGSSNDKPLGKDPYRSLLLNGNTISNSSVVLKRSLCTSTGLLSEQPGLVGWEDFDYWIRLAKSRASFKYIDKTLGYYLVGTTNTTQPHRTLEALRSFRNIYKTELRLIEPTWILYTEARCKELMGEVDLANTAYRNVLANNQFSSFHIKAFIRITFILAKKIARL